MAATKDRRTNMIHSSLNAQPAKEGAGGSYVWGSPTSVNDYESKGVGHVSMQIKKAALPADMPVPQDAYVNDLDNFPALAPAVGARPESLTYSVVGRELAASDPVPGFAAPPGPPPVCVAAPAPAPRTTKRTTVQTDGMHGVGFATNQCEHPDMTVGGAHGGRGGRSSALTEMSSSHAFAGDFTSGYAQMPWAASRKESNSSVTSVGRPVPPVSEECVLESESKIVKEEASKSTATKRKKSGAQRPKIQSMDSSAGKIKDSVPAVEFEPDLSWRPLTAEERKGNLKAVRKEGGIVGINLEGASHLGGTQFFCNSVSEPKGDQELLIESVKAMNAKEKKVTRAHEARAGCSADVAKMIVSSNPCQIQVAAYVPKALQNKLTPSDWLNEVMTWYDGTINFHCSSGEMCIGTMDDLQGYGMGYEVLLCHHSTDILQRLGLMASSEHVHHHDDEIFGEDHLPGMSEHRKSTIRQARKSTLNKMQQD